MEVRQLMEKSPLVDISVPETSDFSPGTDVAESDDRDMVIEESPIKEETIEDKTDMEETSSPYTSSPFASPTAPPFSSSTFNTQAEMAPPCDASESDSFGTAAVDIFYSSSPERRAPASEAEPDDQMMDEMAESEEDRILELTEDDSEEIVDTVEEKEDHAEELEGLVQETEVLVEEREDHVEESENRVDETEDHVEETQDHVEETDHVEEIVGLVEEIEDQTEDKDYAADDDQTEDIIADTEEQIMDKVTEEKEDGTLNTVSEEENEDQAPAEEDQSGVVMPEEEDSQTVEPDMSMQSAAEETAESSVLDDSVGTPLLSGNLADTEALSASVDKPVKAGRATMKSKSAVRRRGSKEKSTKVKQKVAKGSASKVSVPTVTVTAPSDQSDDSEVGKRSAASTPVDTMLSGFPKRIENTDNLPPGWRRIAVLRVSGLHAGRYDTTLFSDTNVKMRSFPNVRNYLLTTQQAHFLNNEQYDFKFKQPFSIPKGIRKDAAGKPASVKASKIKTPPKDSAKGSKNKTPASTSKKSSKSDTPTTTKVCMTLKRKVPLGADGSDSQSAESGSPGVSSIWEVKQAPKTKARKKTTQAAKKDSPQLKLDAFIAKFKSFPVAKESKFKSSFKTVLRNTSPPKKSEEVTVAADGDDVTAPKVDADPYDVSSEKSNEVVEEVEETKQDTETVEVLSDEGSNKGDEFVSDVYLAEEQEEPYKSDEEEESCAAVSNTDDASMEMEGTGDEANKDALSEECLSEEASIFELKSEESDNSSVPTPTPESVPQDTAISNDSKLSDPVISKPLSPSVSRTTASKRSLSPSDSDVSARKRSRLWREADIEEDSSRSVGMCSDTSLPPQEEDENQNMASKVQKMHLSDSSSSKDMKDSASTSSSNCSSLPPTTSLLPPSWSKSRAKGVKGSPASQAGRKSATRKSLTTSDNTASAAFAAAETSQAVKTNGATGTRPLKVHRDVTWNPPRSPFNLIQERLYHDPWKLLLATIFLHEVEAEVAIPLLWKFLNRWGNAEQVQATETERIARLLQPMERNEACAAAVVRFSEEYLTKDWKYPIELHGIQQYGNDSFRIFCIPEWDQVTPGDERLRGYCLWLNQNREELGLE